MILRPILRPITASPLHGMFGRNDLPTIPPGEKFLTDENGDYLTDEQGNYLTGSLT